MPLHRPQRGLQSAAAEFRARRSQATAWGRGHCGPHGRLSISPAPRAQNGHQEPRALGGRQVAGDRRPGGGQASRCGESGSAGRPDWAREGRRSGARVRGEGGPEAGRSRGGPGPVDRLPRSPPGAAIAPRSARRGAHSSRLLPGGTRGGLAPPSPEPLAGYPSPTAEPGTGRSPARPPLDFGY